MNFKIYSKKQRSEMIDSLADHEEAFVMFADFLEKYECPEYDWTKTEFWQNAKTCVEQIGKMRHPTLHIKKCVEEANVGIEDYCFRKRDIIDSHNDYEYIRDSTHERRLSSIRKGYFSAVCFMLIIEGRRIKQQALIDCVNKIEKWVSIEGKAIADIFFLQSPTGFICNDYNYLLNQALVKNKENQENADVEPVLDQTEEIKQLKEENKALEEKNKQLEAEKQELRDEAKELNELLKEECELNTPVYDVRLAAIYRVLEKAGAKIGNSSRGTKAATARIMSRVTGISLKQCANFCNDFHVSYVIHKDAIKETESDLKKIGLNITLAYDKGL